MDETERLSLWVSDFECSMTVCYWQLRML